MEGREEEGSREEGREGGSAYLQVGISAEHLLGM